MNPIRLAVVGTGALGRHHARILSEMEGVTLVGVADSNPAAAADVASRCQTEAFGDYHELIERVDAVVVAVPTSVHLPVASAFLSQGIDVFVEKPIALNLEEARQLVDLAQSQKCLLQVGHVERFNPALLAARPHLSAPKYIRAERFSPFAFRSTDIGVVHDVMIHDIDLVLSLVSSRVERVEAFGISILGRHEDCVQARIHFRDGCIADLSANRVSPVTRRDMQVWSAEGCAHLDFSARRAVLYQASPTLKYGTSPLERAREPGADIEQLRKEVFGTYIKVHEPTVAQRDQLTEELLAFTDCIRSRKSPLVSGEDAAEAMAVAEQIVEQVATHAWDAAPEGATGPFLHRMAPRKLAG
jgi:predicted dehydrogenase